MKNDRYFICNKSKAISVPLIILLGLVVSSGCSQQDLSKVSEEEGNACEGERRDMSAMLAIIDDQKHNVSTYNSYGNNPVHVSSGGSLKLKIKNGQLDTVKMRMQGSGGDNLQQKVTGTNSLVNDPTEDILTITAETIAHSSNKPKIEHEYTFEFTIPCEGVDKGDFTFDFKDIDEPAKKLAIQLNKTAGDDEIGPDVGHGRGTGGGQNP